MTEEQVKALAREDCPICGGIGVGTVLVFETIDGENTRKTVPCSECQRVEAALRAVAAQVATEPPGGYGFEPEERLLLNAYGRACYTAGQKAQREQDAQIADDAGAYFIAAALRAGAEK